MTTDNQSHDRLLNKLLNEPAAIRKVRPLDLIEAALDYAEDRGFDKAKDTLAAAREQGRQEGIRDALALITAQYLRSLNDRDDLRKRGNLCLAQAHADQAGALQVAIIGLEALLVEPVADCSTTYVCDDWR